MRTRCEWFDLHAPDLEPMVSRPRVPDVVNKKTANFTIDALVEMLSRVGKPVKLAIS